MCEYCIKLTQKSHKYRNGYDVTVNSEGESFIDFFGNLVTHIETKDEHGEPLSIETQMPIKFCPWCGGQIAQPRARVLTLTEVQHIDPEKEYWEEYASQELYKDKYRYDAATDTLISQHLYSRVKNVSQNYNRTQRIWTGLPTERQMESTPWLTH